MVNTSTTNMNKIFITTLLTLLLLLPAGINASESKTYPSYQVSTPITPTFKPIAVQPTTSQSAVQQAVCNEKIIEKTIIKETKEIVVLPKGMSLIKNLSELKKLKKGSKTWRDQDGKLYLLKQYEKT